MPVVILRLLPNRQDKIQRIVGLHERIPDMSCYECKLGKSKQYIQRRNEMVLVTDRREILFSHNSLAP